MKRRQKSVLNLSVSAISPGQNSARERETQIMGKKQSRNRLAIGQRVSQGYTHTQPIHSSCRPTTLRRPVVVAAAAAHGSWPRPGRRAAGAEHGQAM